MLQHDMRTPLTAAKMSAQLMLRRSQDPDHVARLGSRIVENLNRADEMLRDLLDSSRIQAGQLMAVTVHNRGEPIAERDLGDLFKPYLRTAHARKAAQFGWGLGLTLVKGIIEAHGGSVCVKSDAETGTTFRVDLPRNPPAEDA